MSSNHLIQRVMIRNSLQGLLKTYNNFKSLDDSIQETIIRRLEKGCFEVTINEAQLRNIRRTFENRDFVDIYSSVCYKLMANMDSLIDTIVSTKISKIYDIPHMNSFDMNPKATELERKELEIRLSQKVAPKVSKLYKCYKCGKNETISLEYQGKGGDEACSYSIKCVNCEYIWRT